MLTVVIWSLDLAKRRFETDRVRALKCIDMALEGANSAAQLTARLLAFSRQQALQPKALDVNQLLIGMTEMLRHTIGAHMRVEAVLGAGLWTAYVDHSQIENAILNLAINARDAMTDGGCLTVETSNAQLDTAYALSNPGAVAGEYVLVSVTDTGVGMDAATAAQVYDPFFTTKGPGKGTGLGLSQVQGFVKQSGGHVKIYSEPGHGTTVRLYLPRQHDVSGVVNPQLPENDAAAVQAKSGEVILVVEDDERIRSLSVDALRDLGYTVVHAADGTQALAILGDERRIDLLFTDIVMPFMNGRQLAAKAHEARPELKVLYTTGFTRDVVVHKGELDANEALIGKPFTLAELTMKVRLVLDGRDGCRETSSQMN
jgi:CheY-like chemotaxis protein